MVNKHQEFMKKLRSIMLEMGNDLREESDCQNAENTTADEEDMSLDEYLAAKFDAIFVPIEDD